MAEFLSSLMRHARGMQKMTLRTLSGLVEKSPSFLSEIETGIRPAPKDNDFLSRLADALNLDRTTVCEAATREREARDPKRLRNIFKHDQELMACYYRVNEQEISDKQLREALYKALIQLEKGEDNGSSASCAQNEGRNH